MIKNKKKISALVFLILISTILTLNIYENHSPYIVPVTFSKKTFPMVNVNIQGNQYPLYLFLASPYPLFISEKKLIEIRKSRKGEAHWKNLMGEQENAPLFEVRQIELGKLKLKKILTSTEPEDEESVGSISWPLGRINLFLDFPHHRIAGIKNEKNLASLGYDIRKMEKIKCRITEKGIYFRAISSFGELNMMLITSGNANIINRSIWNGPDNSLKTAIRIGNKDFHVMEFYPAELTQELEIDGVLGAEFLKNHIVYIDARNEYLYIGGKYCNTLANNSDSKIPVNFTVNGLPIIEIEVRGKREPVMVDLGYSRELLFRSGDFCADGLYHIDTSHSVNVIGREDETDCYILPDCKIGNSLLKNLFVNRQKEIGAALGINVKKAGTIQDGHFGYLGRPILYRTNIYFDFPDSALRLINQEGDLKKINVRLEEYAKVSFKPEECGIVLSTKTDLGELRLLLDTGCSVSLIKSEVLNGEDLNKDSLGNSYFCINTLVLGNCQYEKMNFYPFDISPKMENIDGILGMDFLRKHAFYIDYPNHLIYFRRPQTTITKNPKIN